MACILGGMWYIWNLVEYQRLRGKKPFNVLVSQEDTGTGTITPSKKLLSGGDNIAYILVQLLNTIFIFRCRYL